MENVGWKNFGELRNKQQNRVFHSTILCMHVCVCVCVCVPECDLVSVGVVDVFRGQGRDHRRLSLTLDVH